MTEMNETDINEYNVCKLIEKCYMDCKFNKIASERVKYVFVGDIHGDLHQLLFPLIRYNVVSVGYASENNLKWKNTNEILDDIQKDIETDVLFQNKAIDKKKCVDNIKELKGLYKTLQEVKLNRNIDMYTFNISINPVEKWLCDKIIVLGDLVDVWISSRYVVKILHDLVSMYPKQVVLIIGNHDARHIGCYLRCLHEDIVYSEISPMWCSLKKSLSADMCVRFIKDSVVWDNIPKQIKNKYNPRMYVDLYMIQEMFMLHELFRKKLFKVCDLIYESGKSYIISHTFWSAEILSKTITRIMESEYPYECIESKMGLYDYPNIAMYVRKSMNTFQKNALGEKSEDVSTGEKPEVIVMDNEKMLKFVSEINEMFYNKSYAFLAKPLLLTSRFMYKHNTESAMGYIDLDFIVGHTFPNNHHVLNVNVGLDLQHKLLGDHTVNGGSVRYFDFGSSAGYDLDTISKPRFVSFSYENEFQLEEENYYKFVVEGSRYKLCVFKNGVLYDSSVREFVY